MTHQIYKIKDFCQVGDGAHASIKRGNTGIMYLSSKNFKSHGLDLTNLDYISQSDYEKHFKVSKSAITTPSANDVLLGIIGSIGVPYIVKKGDLFGISSSVAILRTQQGLDANYLFQFMKSSFFQQSVEAIKSGAAQGFLSLEMIRNLPLIAPEESLQQQIADILTAYDDLIETNNQRIATLEAIAQQIYKEWFVRLRFPNWEHTPFHHGIPDGWAFGIASDFFTVVKGKSYKGDELTENTESMPFITLKSFNRGGGYREDGLKYYSGRYNKEQVVYKNDVVMAVTDMTQDRVVVGRVARVPDFGDKGAVISLDVIKLVPHSITKSFLYSYMRHSGFGDYIKEFANGANVLHLKPDLVAKQKVMIPPNSLQEKFSDLVEPIYEQMDALSTMNKNAVLTRNLLLPRLISGKLTLKQATQQITSL